MKSLLFSCKNFNSKIKELADRPIEVDPEPITQTEFKTEKSITTLINVEKGDDIIDIVPKFANEIKKFCKDTGIKTIVICPFAHLSNNLASSKESRHFLDLLQKELTDFEVVRVHFGSHKSLLLDVHGHKGNIRFREF